MTYPGSEDLIGYLLGALEPDEQARIEQLLDNDPELRSQLRRLDDELQAMREQDVADEPPLGLAERTCRAVADFDRVEPMPASAQERHVNRWRWSVVDVVVAAGVCIAAAMLFFPAIANSRHQAQIVACQDNLRQISVALTKYAENNDGYFPSLSSDGKCEVAGYYAPTLMDLQLVRDKSVFVCPSSPMQSRMDEWEMPTRRDLASACEEVLSVLRRDMGGSYAFTLGYMENGRLVPTRNLRRANFAILADSPCGTLRSAMSSHHGSCGQNVLFEDCHVEFVDNQSLRATADSFYENRLGQRAAGIDANDAVVGSSATFPAPMSMP